MAIAAYTKKVQVSSDGVTYYDVPATDASLETDDTILDDTIIGQTSPAYKSSLYGLKGWSVTMTILYDPSDNGFTTIRDAWLNNNTLYVKYLPNGTSGFSANKALVENFTISGDVDGLETVAVTLRGASALSTV